MAPFVTQNGSTASVFVDLATIKVVRNLCSALIDADALTKPNNTLDVLWRLTIGQSIQKEPLGKCFQWLIQRWIDGTITVEDLGKFETVTNYLNNEMRNKKS